MTLTTYHHEEHYDDGTVKRYEFYLAADVEARIAELERQRATVTQERDKWSEFYNSDVSSHVQARCEKQMENNGLKQQLATMRAYIQQCTALDRQDTMVLGRLTCEAHDLLSLEETRGAGAANMATTPRYTCGLCEAREQQLVRERSYWQQQLATAANILNQLARREIE